MKLVESSVSHLSTTLNETHSPHALQNRPFSSMYCAGTSVGNGTAWKDRGVKAYPSLPLCISCMFEVRSICVSHVIASSALLGALADKVTLFWMIWL